MISVWLLKSVTRIFLLVLLFIWITFQFRCLRWLNLWTSLVKNFYSSLAFADFWKHLCILAFLSIQLFRALCLGLVGIFNVIIIQIIIHADFVFWINRHLEISFLLRALSLFNILILAWCWSWKDLVFYDGWFLTDCWQKRHFFSLLVLVVLFLL